MLVLSRTFVLFLLVIDWVEDPHFGNYLFSRALASTDVSPLDLGFRQGKGHDEAERDLDPGSTIVEMAFLPHTLFSIPLDETCALVDHSLESMYVFMSLQL
jgi:hypothetical protein